MNKTVLRALVAIAPVVVAGLLTANGGCRPALPDPMAHALLDSGYVLIPPIAVVTDSVTIYDEGRSRLENLLDGMGLAYDLIDNTTLGNAGLSNYDLVIVAGSSSRELVVDQAGEDAIISALERGTSVLWIGSGIWGTFETTRLPDAFGIRYIEQGWSDDMGIAAAGFKNLAGEREELKMYKENTFRVRATDSNVESFYVDGGGVSTGIPFVTKRAGAIGTGAAVYISVPLLDYWKAGESPDTFARAEVVYKYIRDLLRLGSIAKNPVKDAKDAVLILRLEDYTPGGSWFRKSMRRFTLGMDNLLELTKANDLPLNIGIVPRYSHPYTNEFHAWDSPDKDIQLLRSQAQTAFDRGGSLIVHGFDHQNGQGKDDLSGDDWELWDEEEERFLPYGEQKAVTDSAMAEIKRVWKITPTVWETPHYSGNFDTYHAAASSGFKYATESDTKLFPNRQGFLNHINGNLLNIPETGFDFRWEPEDIRTNTLLKQLKVFPRIVRMQGLYYVFYHNISTQQHKGLSNFLRTAGHLDLWKPNVERYAQFWEQRERTELWAYRSRALCRLHASVHEAKDGLTLTVRLPNGAMPQEVLLDGKRVEAKTEERDRIWYVYPVLSEGSSEVTIQYAGDRCIADRSLAQAQ